MNINQDKIKLDGDKTFTVLHLCVGCKHTGEWRIEFTDGVKHFNNFCEHYLQCPAYTKWWESHGEIVDKTLRL